MKVSSWCLVVCTGPTADSLTYLSGGWTLHWGGAMSEEEFAYGTTVVEAIKAQVSDAVDIPSVDIKGRPVEGSDR